MRAICTRRYISALSKRCTFERMSSKFQPWRSGVIDRIAKALDGQFFRAPKERGEEGPGKELYVIEFADRPAAWVARTLDDMMLESPRTLLIGVYAYHVDPETGEMITPAEGMEWRMLGNRAPGTLAVKESADRLAGWADSATRKSRVVLMAKSLTIRVYPVGP